jgi:hypothetical protein
MPLVSGLWSVRSLSSIMPDATMITSIRGHRCVPCANFVESSSIFKLFDNSIPAAANGLEELTIRHVDVTNFIDARAASSLPIFLALETRQIPMICIWLYFENYDLPYQIPMI